MAKHARQPPPPADAKPTLAMTKFGVNTPCCDAVRAALESEYELLTFHATGLQPNVPHCCLRSDEGLAVSIGSCCISSCCRNTLAHTPYWLDDVRFRHFSKPRHLGARSEAGADRLGSGRPREDPSWIAEGRHMLVAYSDSEDEEDKPSTTCAAPATRAPPCHPRCSATLPALRRGAAPPPPVAPAPPKKKQINLGQLLQQNDQELSLKEKLPANFFDAPAERDAGEDDDADAPPQKGWAGLSALLPPPTARPKSTGGASSLYARAQKLGSGRPKKLTLPPDPAPTPTPTLTPYPYPYRYPYCYRYPYPTLTSYPVPEPVLLPILLPVPIPRPRP